LGNQTQFLVRKYQLMVLALFVIWSAGELEVHKSASLLWYFIITGLFKQQLLIIFRVAFGAIVEYVTTKRFAYKQTNECRRNCNSKTRIENTGFTYFLRLVLARKFRYTVVLSFRCRRIDEWIFYHYE